MWDRTHDTGYRFTNTTCLERIPSMVKNKGWAQHNGHQETYSIRWKRSHTNFATAGVLPQLGNFQVLLGCSNRLLCSTPHGIIRACILCQTSASDEYFQTPPSSTSDVTHNVTEPHYTNFHPHQITCAISTHTLTLSIRST